MRILVAEDGVMIADLIADELKDQGCDVVGPVPRVEQGLGLAKTEHLDCALLDIDLAGEMSFPIAAVLVARGVPFAFLTGYTDSTVPAIYRGVPRLAKPFYLRDLVAFISNNFRKAA
jgi:DNA-binding response OmpR family regulator